MRTGRAFNASCARAMPAHTASTAMRAHATRASYKSHLGGEGVGHTLHFWTSNERQLSVALPFKGKAARQC
eukprot:5664639-Pleurochrysis_carterae.AAC.1